jgi:hypothetical protein
MSTKNRHLKPVAHESNVSRIRGPKLQVIEKDFHDLFGSFDELSQPPLLTTISGIGAGALTLVYSADKEDTHTQDIQAHQEQVIEAIDWLAWRVEGYLDSQFGFADSTPGAPDHTHEVVDQDGQHVFVRRTSMGGQPDNMGFLVYSEITTTYIDVDADMTIQTESYRIGKNLNPKSHHLLTVEFSNIVNAEQEPIDYQTCQPEQVFHLLKKLDRIYYSGH